MEVIYSSFNILSTIITDILYDKAMINNLFSFDLDKKSIHIKKNKNTIHNSDIKLKLNLNDNSKLCNQNFLNPLKNKSISEIIKNKDELNKDGSNHINEVPIQIKNKIKKRKLIIKASFPKYNINKDKNKNNFDDGMKSKDKLENIETDSKKESNKESNRNFVERIKMNFCYLYFWFCCFCFRHILNVRYILIYTERNMKVSLKFHSVIFLKM